MKKIFLYCLLGISALACQPKKQEEKSTETVMEKNTSTFVVGTYTRKEGHVDGKGKGVYVYEMDNETGEISYVSVSDEIISPSYVAIHPSGKYVYAANEFDAGEDDFARVTALAYDQNTRSLSYLNEVSSMGQYPCFVSVDDSGNFVMAANYVGGSVGLYPIEEGGLLGEASSYKKHEGGSKNPRQDAPHAHQIIQRPGTNQVYAVDLGANKVYEYALDTLSQTLDEVKIYEVKPAESGPRHMAFHPTKSLAYLLNELSGTVEVISLEGEEKFSKSLQNISTVAEGVEHEGASGAIKVDAKGKFVYATNRGEINEIVVFKVGEDGLLTDVQHQSTAGLVPRDFEIDPSGKFLLAANQDSNTIVTFRINQETGKLEETGLVAEVPSPVCIKFF